MKRQIYILVTFILFLSCTDENKNLVTPPKKLDSVKLNINYQKTKKIIDTIFNYGSVIIYGDSTIHENEISSVLVKFEPYISFDDFKVKVENVKAELDLKSHKLGEKFRTAIKYDYDNPEALFAGHYTFATWGCGSPCQMHVLIDRRSGKIYDAPDSSVGSEFKKDSRMLIINPPEENGYFYNDCSYCKPEIYILNEKTKLFEKKEPYKK